MEYIWEKQNDLLAQKIQTKSYRQKSKSTKGNPQNMNFIFLGDPNAEPAESAIRDFSILIIQT